MRLTLVADNSTSPNWGCRATSFALRELLSREHVVVGSVTRALLQGPLTYASRIPPRWHREAVRRFHRPRLLKMPLAGGIARAALATMGSYRPPTHEVEEEAELLWSARFTSPKAKAIHDALDPCEAIVVNAEGEMVFSSPARATLLQTLAICVLARRMGKQVFWLNGMVSAAPDSPLNAQTVALADRVLAEACMTVRDPRSQALADSLLPGRVSRMVPDALFGWSHLFAANAALPYDAARLTAWFDRTGVARPDCTDQPYIVLSGSSLSARNQALAADTYTALATALVDLGRPVLLVETCIGDKFLRDVARRTGLPILPVDTPIMAGAAIMANARAFVSGRWHPGIMAALGGTPCVFMGSNSHKTGALQEMLHYSHPVEYSAFPNAAAVAAIVEATRRCLDEGDERRAQIAARAASLARDLPQLLDTFA